MRDTFRQASEGGKKTAPAGPLVFDLSEGEESFR